VAQFAGGQPIGRAREAGHRPLVDNGNVVPHRVTVDSP
jgi:hypothetical protein